MATYEKLIGREYPGVAARPAAQRQEKPVVFLLPALIDDDPDFDRAWEPLRKPLNMVRVSYPNWTELVQPGADFSLLVSRVKRQIEARSPNGPLMIVGYSLGGLLAYACAVELEAEGRSVSRVAILDAPANIKHVALPQSKRLRNRFRSLRKFDLRGAIASVVAKALTRDFGLPLLRRMVRFRDSALPWNFDRYLHRKITMQMELRLFHPWWQALSLEHPMLAAPAFIFRSADYESYEDESLGWNQFCSDWTTARVAGDHGSMLFNDENRSALFSRLTELLRT